MIPRPIRTLLVLIQLLVADRQRLRSRSSRVIDAFRRRSPGLCQVEAVGEVRATPVLGGLQFLLIPES